MKKSLFALFFALFLAQTGIAQPPTERLIAFYSFNDSTATDQAGNGSNGAPVGSPLIVCGVDSAGVRFSGAGDHIIFVGPINDVFTAGDFTVSFFFKPQSSAGTQVILAKQLDCTDQRNSFIVRYNYASNKISATIAESDSLKSNVIAKLDDDPCWQHIALVKRNQRFSLFVNGILRDDDTAPRRLELTSPSLFTVGKPICTSDKFFKGDFDELRIYNKALSDDEITLAHLRPDQIGNRDTLIYLGDGAQIFVTGSTNSTTACGSTFSWQPTTGVSDPAAKEPFLAPTVSTTYRLSIIHSDCVAQDSIFIQVIDPDTLDCSRVFLPNAFTPNGDGRNETFGISNPFAVPDLISFEVFDRWGGRLFSSESAHEQWDGRAGGKEVNPGIFLWRLHYRCQGEEKVRSGSLTLIR